MMYAVLVVGVDKLGPFLSGTAHPLRRIAEQRLKRVIPPHGTRDNVPIPYRIVRGADDQPESLLAHPQGLFDLQPLSPLSSFAQCALHRRSEARHPMLQDIIRGAMLEGRDRDLLTKRAGNEEKRNVRPALACQHQSG